MATPARLNIAALAVAIVVSACRSVPPASGPVSAPPIAPKSPHVKKIHGERLIDNYYWLRKKNNPHMLAYLKAENAYTDWFTKPMEPLQETLYKEMLARIEENDQSVPYRDGDWFYYDRMEAGKQYSICCRKQGSTNAPEQVVLDLNALANGKEFIDLGVYEFSDDGNLLAYTVDETGFQEFTLFVKDMRTGELLGKPVPHVDAAVWAADNKTLFYVTEDDAKRPSRLWRHQLDAKKDALVYVEKNALFTLDLWRSRSKAYIFTASSSESSDEVRFLRADRPADVFKIVAPRVEDQEYEVGHSGELFYIRTNDRGDNFRLVTAPVSNPDRDNWRQLVPHRDNVMLDGVEMFANHYVLLERENGLPQLRVVEITTAKSRRIEFPDSSYAASPENNAEFNTNVFRYGFESLRTPFSVYDYDMTAGSSTLLKRQPVKGGYNPDNYQVERLFALGNDGTRIPISLVRRRDLSHDGPRPLWLDGYGAYGIPEDVWFSSDRISLLDRGVTFAIAHVRGGGEFGRKWYDAGRMLNKRNTFSDFISCADFLIHEGYTSKDKLVINGASAGGLTMGAVLNMRPDLCKVALVEVPFVDVINTMLDRSLPLTVGEFEEWGNPNDKQFYRYIKTYSPYDNITATNYPAMLVKSALNDSRVMYWEPTKYVAKLRAMKTDANPLLFKIDLSKAGHNGKSGRYDALHDLAFNYAFILTQLGIAK